jgi:small subunit ribosomal protein S6e
MADFKVVVSDPKTKSYQFDVKGPDANKFIGKVIGETVDGGVVGLAGYTLKITGGTDKSGFVMRSDLQGSTRQRILVAVGTGYKAKSKGVRRRKFMRGKEIAPDIIQINTTVAEYGDKPIEAILGGSAEEETVEDVEE